MQSSYNQRPCKFGDQCRKNARGLCNFYHPPLNQYQRGQEGMNGNMRTQNYNYAPSYSNNNRGNYEYQRDRQRDNERQQPWSSYQNYNQNYGNQSISSHRQYESERSQERGIHVFCKQFHLGGICRNGSNCNKKHSFLLNNQEDMKRFIMTRQMPNHVFSKLTRYYFNEKDYFGLRQGNIVSFLDYNCENPSFASIFNWALPVENAKYNFYLQKNSYIYYSLENGQTIFDDIGFFSLQESINYSVSNAHCRKVTGMDHLGDYLLTCSLDGQLKFWKKEEDKLIIDADLTNHVKSILNPDNTKMELLLLDVSMIGQEPIIAIGTSDARLFLLIGSSFTYMEITFPQIYARIFKIKHIIQKGVPHILTLAWDNTNTRSALVSVNLNTRDQRILLETQNSVINVYEIVKDYLFVGMIDGQVSIYRYPDTKTLIGGIRHQNIVSDIVYSETKFLATGLSMHLAFILEKKTVNNEGSLAVYLIK